MRMWIRIQPGGFESKGMDCRGNVLSEIQYISTFALLTASCECESRTPCVDTTKTTPTPKAIGGSNFMPEIAVYRDDHSYDF